MGVLPESFFDVSSAVLCTDMIWARLNDYQMFPYKLLTLKMRDLTLVSLIWDTKKFILVSVEKSD